MRRAPVTKANGRMPDRRDLRRDPSESAESRKVDDLESELVELRQECARLTESARRYRNFLEFSSEGIWCFEFRPAIPVDQHEDAIIRQSLEGGVMVECNDALARMYGYEGAHGLIGTPLADFMSPNADENIEYIRAFVRSGFRLEDGESHEVDREGGSKYFLNNLVGVVEEGLLVRAWGTQRDVTESRLLEEQLRQAQKMEAVGRIAGGIAHDFNNMLTVIGGSLELVEDELGDEHALSGTLRDASRAAEQATGLTRQLLAFSRRHVVQRGAVDLNAVVADALRMLRRVIREDIEIRSRLAPDLPRVLGDRIELHQVLVNLVLNARDAIDGPGHVSVATAPAPHGAVRAAMADQGGVVLSVSDSGCGMDPATAERVFEPFFTTKETGSGTGLGLATVYATVSRCGGDVRVDSEPGRGSCFRVVLPVAARDVAAEEEALTGVAGDRCAASILLVEDQPELRRLVARVLRGAGHDVTEAEGPAEARRLAAGRRVDLLLSDVVMPGANGLELARELRAAQPGLRVLLMTGYADLPEELGRELLREARLLPKPFTWGHLHSEIQAALRAWTPPCSLSRPRP